MSNNWKHIKKIAISRTDSIGDVLLTLPMAGYLKTIIPDMKIYFIGRTYTKDIIECEQHIDSFINYDELIKESDPGNHLKSYDFDVIFHVFPRKNLAYWSNKANIPLRIGTSHRIFHWWNLNKKVRFTRKRSTLHESQLNFKLMDGLNIPYAPTLEELYNYINFKVPDIDIPIQPKNGESNIILHPGSQGSATNWKPESYFKLAKILVEKGHEVYFTGTNSEAQSWKDDIPEHDNIYDVTGEFSLKEFIGFIDQCNGIIACSTGPLHIGGILGLRTLGLFSPRRPIHPGRWRPLGPNVETIVFDENCPKCKSGRDCNCIEKITPEQVAGRY